MADTERTENLPSIGAIIEGKEAQIERLTRERNRARERRRQAEARVRELEGKLLAIAAEIERKPLVIRNMTQLVGKIRMLASTTPDTGVRDVNETHG